MKQRTIYALITIGGAVGMIASFLETIEYQVLLKNAHAMLACNLNSVFSCSSVLKAWQSTLFGFPNSMLCTLFFTVMFSAGLVGVCGGTIPKTLRLWLQGIALFFLGFALWFMWESTFVIGALCILCLFCLSGLFLLNFGWLRLNAPDTFMRDKSQRLFASGLDIFVWLVLASIIAFVMVLRFAR